LKTIKAKQENEMEKPNGHAFESVD